MKVVVTGTEGTLVLNQSKLVLNPIRGVESGTKGDEVVCTPTQADIVRTGVVGDCACAVHTNWCVPELHGRRRPRRDGFGACMSCSIIHVLRRPAPHGSCAAALTGIWRRCAVDSRRRQGTRVCGAFAALLRGRGQVHGYTWFMGGGATQGVAVSCTLSQRAPFWK